MFLKGVIVEACVQYSPNDSIDFTIAFTLLTRFLYNLIVMIEDISIATVDRLLHFSLLTVSIHVL